MKSVIPQEPVLHPSSSMLLLIPSSKLNSSYYPPDVDGVVDRASWFALMENVESAKSISQCCKLLSCCCNMHVVYMNSVCSGINDQFMNGKRVYGWTSDDKLSVDKTLLVTQEKKYGQGKRNSMANIHAKWYISSGRCIIFWNNSYMCMFSHHNSTNIIINNYIFTRWELQECIERAKQLINHFQKYIRWAKSVTRSKYPKFDESQPWK